MGSRDMSLEMHDDPDRAPEPSDALVLFDVSGDLAFKKIFPALYAKCKEGTLSVPMIGVASWAWNIERLCARAKESIEDNGAVADAEALDQLLSLLKYVSGDYKDPGTFDVLKKMLGAASTLTIATSRRLRRTLTSRPTARCGRTSTPGVGPGCRGICAQENAWPTPSPR